MKNNNHDRVIDLKTTVPSDTLHQRSKMWGHHLVPWVFSKLDTITVTIINLIHIPGTSSSLLNFLLSLPFPSYTVGVKKESSLTGKSEIKGLRRSRKR